MRQNIYFKKEFHPHIVERFERKIIYNIFYIFFHINLFNLLFIIYTYLDYLYTNFYSVIIRGTTFIVCSS